MDTVYNISKTLRAVFLPHNDTRDHIPDERYKEYLMLNYPSPEELSRQRQSDMSGMPFFGIAITGSEEERERSVASVNAQTYPNYAILVSPKQDEFDYIMYLRAGDTLSPDCLYRFAMEAKGHDLLYCDEDRLVNGQRGDPFFKWRMNIVTMLSFDMLGMGVAVSRELFQNAGGLYGVDRDEWYEYNLRIARNCKSPLHIPRVLYTCGRANDHTPYALEKVTRYAPPGETVFPGEWGGSFRAERQMDKQAEKLKAAIIIYCKNDCDGLMRLLMSIDGAVRAKNVKVIVADGNSTDKRTIRYYDILCKNKAAYIYKCDSDRLPELLNGAARRSRADAVVFMDSGVEALEPGWLKGLISEVMRKDVGAAGPKLIDPGGRLLHTGTVIGIGGWQGSPYSGTEDDKSDGRKRRFVNTLRAVSGLSYFCMAVDLEKFLHIGGFDESFEETGFDTELCLRMAGRGYSPVFVPSVIMRCHRPLYNMAEASRQDRQRFYDCTRDILISGDPNYNPNYDCGSLIPVVAPQPEPAIVLNPMYNE